MSTSTVYVVPKSGPVQRHAKLSNSWGFCMRIWNSLYQHYRQQDFPMMDPEKIEEFWGWSQDESIPLAYRAVLMTTYDNVIMEWDHLAEMARYFREFAAAFPTQGADHLPTMSAMFDELLQSGSEGMAGVCFQGTSVSEDTWTVGESEETEETDEVYRPYDITRDNKHWFLFAHLTPSRGAQIDPLRDER